MSGLWRFFIDVGGTFTDVVVRRPDGAKITFKLLSSGAFRGEVGPESNHHSIVDPARIGDPPGFWEGWTLQLSGSGPANGVPSDDAGAPFVYEVTQFDTSTGRLSLKPVSRPVLILDDRGRESASMPVGAAYELRSDEPAPVAAIRFLMGLRGKDPIGPVEVRLGTTRATNALLERKGARTALVTTRGFADILKIGHQDRPDLFKLHIRKRDELTECVVEIGERLAADGRVLKAPDERDARSRLIALREAGIEALAICLIHAHVNPAHEEFIARIAESLGFPQVSLSSRVTRLEGMVSRGDTTVADAYLGPVIHAYVAELRRCLPEARIRLMTSAGGLINADSVTGKDTILSGPAGGVVGCGHVARAAGFDKVIGFDMGGTSTDVCRVDLAAGAFEYQHETVKAGVRIKTPMLAIETVAAGGGSICGFDGQMLTVGPRSAGAEPGPACYGRGGPLTVTDMNLVLGRVSADHFPFRLDRAAVDQWLSGLCETVNQATGSVMTPVELAEGFVRIANANMAAAIKQVTLARGYDVREYTLVTFGGAGGQHACAVAKLLGIRRVLCSPYAGVLSALGIGIAPVKRIAQRTVVVPLDDRWSDAVRPLFSEMVDATARQLEREQEGLAPIQVVRSLDLCYAGQATLLTVPVDPPDGVRDSFERMHRQLYGYIHEGRGVEIRTVRIELTVQSMDEPADAADHSSKTTQARTAKIVESGSVTRLYVRGTLRDVPLLFRPELKGRESVAGPAVIIESGSTIVVDEGWNAEVLETGDIALTSVREESSPIVVSREANPIDLELFHRQFAAIAGQMGTTLRRTALSTNVKERLDFSCAVFTPEGDLVVNAPHIPVHLGGMSDCVKALMEDVGRFAPGDVYVTNDPYRGGSHLNDVTVITPVHDEAGSHILSFVASRAHHAEIGGTRPGSMPPDSRCLAEEGVLIRAFAWIRDGKPRLQEMRDLLTSAAYPSRAVDDNLADLSAQVAANQSGISELRAMMARYGVDVVHDFMRHIRDAAERKMRAALAKLPDGVHRFEDRMDDGAAIRLAVTIQGDEATFDFTGTDGVRPGNLNANRSIVTSAVLYCLRCLIDEDIPLNAGILAPIRIVLPECFLNPPGHADPHRCPAIAGGNVETSQRIVDAVFGALKVVAASQGTMNNLLMGNRRFGYYETICGGAGAGPGFDGADAVHTHMTNTRLTDPEVLESRYPVRLIRFEIRRGSGGAGRSRGGCGVVREMEFLEPLDGSIISQRRVRGPYGLEGGEPGDPGRNLLVRSIASPGVRPESVPLGSTAQFQVNAGDRLILETPGGGGWGKVSGD